MRVRAGRMVMGCALLLLAAACSSDKHESAQAADASTDAASMHAGTSGSGGRGAGVSGSGGNSHGSGGMSASTGGKAAPSNRDGGAMLGDSGTANADLSGDTYAPFADGANYYAQFPHGPPSDASFFPITVWLQSPDRAKDYAAIGINTYIGLWDGPTEDQLSMLTAAKMPVACDQNDVGLAHLDDSTVAAWTQQDEPDNAQSEDAGYGPCISAKVVQQRYADMRKHDATRPVFLNLGQGVAHDYIGWGNECAATHPGDYVDYVAGADIVSFDIYPSNETSDDVAGKLWFVAEGVKNLVKWSAGKKPVWNWIECTGLDDAAHKPTPAQVKAEVWMSIVNGSMGIGYFVHQFNPSFDEHALLDDAQMSAAVSAINAQISELAPVLNTKPVTNAGVVMSSNVDVPVDMLIKRHVGTTYVFAVAMRGTATHAKFSQLTHVMPNAKASVLGENRDVALSDSSFEDDFEPWGVHIYELH